MTNLPQVTTKLNAIKEMYNDPKMKLALAEALPKHECVGPTSPS